MADPHIPPSVGIFDEPGITICLNSEWASFVDGALSALAGRAYWKGTDEEIDTAIDQVEQLLARLGEIGECIVSSTPVGAIMMHGAATAPDGWLLCEGQEVSRDTYAALFAAIGETWGDGDGATTFNLPDFRYRSPMGPGESDDLLNSISIGSKYGENRHTLTTLELAGHAHGLADPGHAHSVTDPGHNHPPLSPLTSFFGGRSAGSNALGGGSTAGAVLTTGTNTTGISLQNSATGISVNAAGGNVAHNTVHPITGVPFIIFAGV